MSAIITNNFRRTSRHNFIEYIGVQDDFFIGLGKTDKWPDNGDITEDDSTYSVPLPNGTIIEDADVLDNLISLVKVDHNDALIPKNSWVSGRKYKVYNPHDPLLFDYEGDEYPCYVTANNKVYVCLDNNDNAPSTEAIPTSYTTFDDDHVYQTADGYIWAYIQTNDAASKFDSTDFIKVNDDLTDATLLQNAKNATGGLLYGFVIENGGSGLPDDVNINLRGVYENGSLVGTNIRSQRFNVTISGGSIISIKYDNITSDAITGINKAIVEASDNITGDIFDNVKIRPLIAPLIGFGAKPKQDTPSFYAGCYARFEGNVDGEALIDTPIRQISLIKGPERRSDYSPTSGDEGSVYADDQALDALQYIQFSTGFLTEEYPSGTLMLQGSARGYIDKVDLVNDRIYYHSNSNYGINHVPFTSDANIIIEDDTLTHANISNVVLSEYIHDTGEVLFVDHRKKITRNIDQTEDIKIVIQF